MSTPAKRASPSAQQGSAYKKRKLETNWLGQHTKAQANALVAELEAMEVKLARARADGVEAAHAHAEKIALLRGQQGVWQRLAARYKSERDTACTERDAASSERNAVVQERDKVQAAVVLLDREKDELEKQLGDVTKWRDNYKGLYLDSRADSLDLVDKLEDATEKRDEFEEKYKSYKKKTLNRDKKLAEALEQCKTARELGRREAAADVAAAKARAAALSQSLKAELAESKSYKEELESVKAQLDTAMERLRQIAAHARQQARMSAMIMNPDFMSLGNAAFPAVPAGEPQQVLTVD